MKINIKPKAQPTEQSNLNPVIEDAPALAPAPASNLVIVSKPAPTPAPALAIKQVLKKNTEISVMGGKTIEETYQDKDLRQHIYDKPSTYAGSIEPNKEPMWVYDTLTKKIIKKPITFIEVFFKCFDEILVNAIDQHKRIHQKLIADPSCKLKPVKNISVTLDKETGWITVENDGEGIEITKHAKNDKYVPQMLFGQLLTSINYDKNEIKLVGGTNGYGAKITNIFSKQFIIETVDSSRKLKFTQTYRENMTIEEPPLIESYNKVPYTKIKYLPDYERFGINDFKIIDDWELLARRVYDSSACTDKTCISYLNGEKIAVKTFEDYVNLYIGNKRDTKRIYYAPNERWEVILCLSDGDFDQVSFVNGIFTDRGGKHVSHVTDNLTKKLAEELNEKHKKKGITTTPAVVKKYLWLFVKADIENPLFDTQTKRKLISLVPNFGSKCELNEDFIANAIKIGILEKTLALTEFKAKEQHQKKSNGSKSRRVFLEKLQDASNAGTAKSTRCKLVLTEGDSAKTFFASGIKALQKEEAKNWGCFPLKGKLLNVRTATLKQLEKNEEIINIIKIIGLVYGKDYSTPVALATLRYGELMILADADRDGDHIKGLIMNFFQYNWPSLVQSGFIRSFATPIIKVWPDKLSRPKPEQTTKFYSEKAFSEWNKTKTGAWTIKYYKGLGTHAPDESVDCFKNMAITKYTWDTTTETEFKGAKVNSCKFAIELAFSKKLEDDRKAWLINYDEHPTEEPAYDVKEETIADFINKRMILFSKSDNIRSIPSLYDGLKPAQRKAIFSFRAGNMKKEIKLSQLVGDMLKLAGYHHGNTSAEETIIGLAQDYVGAGNINLLYPNGQFGSRFKNGKDHASARYIFVGSTPLLNILLNPNDDALLKHVEDDGQIIEPQWYIPIAPLVLINGTEGIGTGWSTSIQCYNPHEIVDNLKRKLAGEEMLEMIPWYRGFNGRVHQLATNKFIVVGNWHRIDKNTIKITELPVGSKNCKSFEKYKLFINSLIDEESAKRSKKKSDDDDSKDDKSEHSGAGFGDQKVLEDLDFEETDTSLIVTLIFKDGILDKELEDNKDFKFEKKIKIAYSFSTTNMHLYTNGAIKKYNSPLEIIDDFYYMRLEYYDRRKKHMLGELEHKLAINNAKFRFVSEIMDGVINIYKKNKAQITAILDGTAKTGASSPAYPMLKTKYAGLDEVDDKVNYEYLLSMRIDSFSEEKLKKLREEIEFIENAIAELEAKTIQSLWITDLDEFINIYDKEEMHWRERHELEIVKVAPKKSATIIKNKKLTTMATATTATAAKLKTKTPVEIATDVVLDKTVIVKPKISIKNHN